MIDPVVVFSYEQIMSVFSTGIVGGLFFGSAGFIFGYVINFLLSLFGDRFN